MSIGRDLLPMYLVPRLLSGASVSRPLLTMAWKISAPQGRKVPIGEAESRSLSRLMRTWSSQTPGVRVWFIFGGR